MMLSKIIRYYRRMQLRTLYKEFYKNATIGDMFEIGTYQANIFNESGNKKNINIGHHTRINGTLYCKREGCITIGNYSVIQNGVTIQCLNNISIGDYSVIAGGSFVTDNNNHRIEPEERVKHRIIVAPGGRGYPGFGDGIELSDFKPVTIGDVVWVGANCLILKGVNIGEGSIVARNSVVTKDVPPYTIVAGNPATIVKKLNKPDCQYFKKD